MADTPMISDEHEMSLEEIEAALEAELEETKLQHDAAIEKQKAVLRDMAVAITAKYRTRAASRSSKEASMLRSEAHYLGSLSTGDYARSGESPFTSTSSSKKRPDRNVVWTRCEIAKAQLSSMQFSGDEKNWKMMAGDTFPGNNPAGSAEAVRLMEAAMSDQLESCGYKAEVLAAIHDMVVLGTGILKGPVNTGKTRKRYQPTQDPETGAMVWVPELYVESYPEIKRVDPWRAYPDDTVTSFRDIGDMIETHPMRKSELVALRKNPAFAAFSENIDAVLEAGPNSYLGDSFQNNTVLTGTNPSPFKDKYIVLEYHGPITKTQLETLELDAPYEVPGDEYFGEVWVCNDMVIRIELENIEGCGKPPYSGDVWQSDPSSPMGFSLAEKLGDAQRVVTQAWHMILDNASASSAPQIVINDEVIDPRNGDYTLRPGKMWYSSDFSGDVSKAFQFFEVPNVTANLFPIMQAASASAEEESGFSLSVGGLQSPQVASDSATGLAIQQRASNVLLDQKSDSLDINMIEPRIQALYDWNMQYNPDNSIKSDMAVKIKPATEYRNKEMYLRDMEKISVEASNPQSSLGKHLDMNVLARVRLAMMSMPTQGMVKPLEQVQQEEEERQQNQQPDPAAIKAMNDSKRLEIEERALGLKEQQLAFELQQNQQREAWEHEERMVATYARITEAQAGLLKSQNEKETGMLQLAARMENESEKLRIASSIALMNDETKKFLGSMNASSKAKDQLLTEREQNIKLKTGSGI